MKRRISIWFCLAFVPLVHAQEDSSVWFSLSKERILVNERSGEFEANLDLFRAGHRKGYFYFLHPAIPRYEPYLKLSGFQVLFILHGGNSNFKRLEGHWNSPRLKRDFLRVYLQSYRHTDWENYTWRTGDERSDRDLRSILDSIRIRWPVDTALIYAAGISAGANYALDMALRQVLPVKGVIGFCPGYPHSWRSGPLTDRLDTSVKVYMVGGEHDFYREQQEELVSFFEGVGLSCRYVLVKGMAHHYPENESGLLEKGVSFIEYP